MCENVNPKVIVDNDFLDLRNVSSRPFSKRPMSTRSITKGSSSIDTQGKASTAKEVLPGLQRLLKTYNKRNSNPFCYKKNIPLNTQPVDSRFRRKIENKSLTSRSESILQENENEAGSSGETYHDHSSESEKRDECPVQTLISESPHKEENCSKARNDNKTCRSVFPFKTVKVKNAIIEPRRKKSSEEMKIAKNGDEDFEKPLNHAQRNVGKNPEMRRDIFERKNMDRGNTNNQGNFEWDNTKIESPCGFHPLPTFKKSWTVPSLPLIKNKLSWTKHYNALCTKVDRKTYEFDTDDTLSDLEDQISAYSSISRSNYMNLIFCLGCLCGIFLIGGILTASEINAEYFGPLESEDGIFQFFYSQISYTFHLILNVFHQILTLPSTKFFRTNEEPKKHWSVLTKYLYFLSE